MSIIRRIIDKSRVYVDHVNRTVIHVRTVDVPSKDKKSFKNKRLEAREVRSED